VVGQWASARARAPESRKKLLSFFRLGSCCVVRAHGLMHGCPYYYARASFMPEYLVN
jgi:hypothetical protein